MLARKIDRFSVVVDGLLGSRGKYAVNHPICVEFAAVPRQDVA
jgi:hypothetical protein